MDLRVKDVWMFHIFVSLLGWGLRVVFRFGELFPSFWSVLGLWMRI